LNAISEASSAIEGSRGSVPVVVIIVPVSSVAVCNDHCLCSGNQGVRRQVRWDGAALVRHRAYQGKQWTDFNALGLQ